MDEEFDAPLAPRCECGGEIEHERTEYQYQDELPVPRPVRRRFAVHIGKCRCCGRRHQGRHPFQTSDALGAAACMLGPRAVALATELNKELGLSPQKTARALERFGIRVTAGGVVQAIARQARALEPTYEALIEGVRASRAVAPDETGWRINGQKAWLWAFAGENVTAYLIAAGRGYRIVCYELEAGQQTVILDTTARGFIAVTGTIDECGTMHGEGTHAGPLALRRRLARLIADDEQLAG